MSQKSKFNLSIKDIILFILPCLIFGISLYIFFPGILTYDSFNQLEQIRSMKFTQAHPFIHTFIEMTLLNIFNSPAVIGAFQILVFAFIWAYACRLTRVDTKMSFIFELVFTIIISIIPVNFINAITLWKDILYSYSILSITILMYVLVFKRSNISILDIILTSINLMFIMFLRHNGKLVAFILIAIIGIIIAVKNVKKLKSVAVFLLTLVISFIVFNVPANLYNVDKGSLTIGPKLLQAVGAFSSNNELSEEDKITLSSFCDLDILNEVYTPYFVDVVVDSITDTPKLNDSVFDLVKIIIKSSFKHPKTAIQYLSKSTSIIWRIDRPSEANNAIYGTIVLIEDYSNSSLNTLGIKMANNETAIYKNVSNIILGTLNSKFLRIILYSHGGILYLQILFVIIIVGCTKKKGYLLLLTPNLLNLISLVVSIPVQDVRYVYSTYLVGYFITLIFINLIILNKVRIGEVMGRKITRLKVGMRFLKDNGIRSSVRKLYSKIKNSFKKKKQIDVYSEWIKNNEPSEDELNFQRKNKIDVKISILVPMYNTKEEFFYELVDSIKNQTHTNFELCLADGSEEKADYIDKIIDGDDRIKYKHLDENKQIAGNTNEALKLATGEFAALLDHDDTLPPFALYEVAKVIKENKNVDFIYTDEDKIDQNIKRYDPHFKPDYSPFLLRSYNYITHFAIIRREFLESIGAFKLDYNGSQDYDLFLRITENTQNIVHIPKILYHWRVHPGSVAASSSAKTYAYDAGKKAIKDHLERLNIKAEVNHDISPGIYKVDYLLKDAPKVSIIIPNKDAVSDLKKCIESIEIKSKYPNYEIIIVENNSTNQSTFNYYDKITEKYSNIKVVKYEEKGFNFSKINNYAVKQSDGEYLLFLNNDIKVISEDFIENMLGICALDGVGIVGAKLLYPDSTVQHAGVVIGIGSVAGHINKLIDKNDIGYYARASVINNYSAVTAACMMVKRNVFDEVNGFTEDLAVAFNDIDFCLKVRSIGMQVVYTPYAKLYHYESKTRGLENTEEKIQRFEGEVKYFKAKWKDILKSGDPYFNPNFRLDVPIYMVDSRKINYEDKSMI